MNHGRYVFTQLLDFIPDYEFSKSVDFYQGDNRMRKLSCRDQFLSMMFGQLAYRESLRDVVTCLQAQESKSYHLGFRSKVFLPTLARANENRDYRIYKHFSQVLIERAQMLYQDDKLPFDLEAPVYIIDSSTIDLSLNLFKWATFRKTKSAIKIHAQMDAKGSIPSVIHITPASVHDVNFLDSLSIEPESYYVFDRGYTSFERLYRIHTNDAFFVIRAKKNLAFNRLYSRFVDKSKGLRCDQIITLTTPKSKSDYPEKLRRIKYYDQETRKYYVYITNDMDIDAWTVVLLYIFRWQIESFFKWIKQHLKIKKLWGRSENAVKTQIYIAICTYLLVAIMKKRLEIDLTMYEILQIFKCVTFRQNTYKYYTFKERVTKFGYTSFKTIAIITFLTRHY